jgi:hypothetical protein
VILGAPLDQGGALPQGVNIAWPNCQLIDGNGNVLLYTISIFVTDAGLAAEHTMQVQKRNPSTNEAEDPCQLINNCNFPFFDAICVGGGTAYLNHSNPQTPCVPVAVAEKTWSEVKNLYN